METTHIHPGNTTQCCFDVGLKTVRQRQNNIRSMFRVHCAWKVSQQARDIDTMLDQCWASVVDGGPTLVKHWVDISCLLGIYHIFCNICEIECILYVGIL